MPADRHPDQSVPATIGHVDGIEAVRAIAVTWVVLFHYLVARSPGIDDPWVAWTSASPTANAIVRNGYLGVDLFFLVTGFLLVMPWVRARAEARPWPSPRDFYARRIRRIVPAYYVQLIFLVAVFVPLIQGVGYVRENAAFVAGNAAAHAMFLHYMTPLTSASFGINGALWTLALEAQFYLLLPLLAPAFVRRPCVVAAAMFAVTVAWQWLCRNDLAALVTWEMGLGARWDVPEAAIRHLLATQLPGYFAHFAVGMGMALAWWRVRDRPVAPREGAAGIVALILASLAMHWAYAAGGGAHLGRLGSWLVTLAALATLFIVLVRPAPWVRNIVSRAPMRGLGRISYSVYLYHLPLLYAWNHFRVLDANAAALPAYLALVVLVAWLSFRFVEKPFLGR